MLYGKVLYESVCHGGSANKSNSARIKDTLLSHSEEEVSEQDDNCSILITALQMKITLS